MSGLYRSHVVTNTQHLFIPNNRIRNFESFLFLFIVVTNFSFHVAIVFVGFLFCPQLYFVLVEVAGPVCSKPGNLMLKIFFLYIILSYVNFQIYYTCRDRYEACQNCLCAHLQMFTFQLLNSCF